MDLPAVASAAGQVASALFAIPAALIAYFAWRTSVNSARATDVLTRIEQTRLHGELMPQFDVQHKLDRSGEIWVTIELTGPPMLPQLNSVEVAIRPIHGADLTEFEPYRIVESGWSNPLIRGELLPLRLADASVIGKASYPMMPIRLYVTSTYKDYEPWVTPLTIIGPRFVNPAPQADRTDSEPKGSSARQ